MALFCLYNQHFLKVEEDKESDEKAKEEEVKEVKYVSAPIPEKNPWARNVPIPQPVKKPAVAEVQQVKQEVSKQNSNNNSNSKSARGGNSFGCV